MMEDLFNALFKVEAVKMSGGCERLIPDTSPVWRSRESLRPEPCQGDRDLWWSTQMNCVLYLKIYFQSSP